MPRVREQFACATNAWGAAAILGVASFLYSINAAAEPPSPILKEYRQRVWTKDDGLPDNWVHSVVQSRNGYLWIGTRFGLARFDGIKFTTIHHPILARDSAHLYLAEDSAGALWIGTPAGLLRYSDGSFAHFTTEDGLWDNYVLALHIGPSDGIWVGTKGGLNRMRLGQLERIEMDDLAPGDPKEVGSVFEDKSGRVWIGTETRLFIRDIATGEPLPIPDSNERLVPGNVFEDTAGMVWLGSKGSLRQLQEGRFVEQARFDDTIGGNIRWFLNDRAGSLWLNTGVSGVRRLSHGQLDRFDSSVGLPDDWVFCGHEDHEGNLWFGTASGGLACWQPRRVLTRTAQDGLPTNQVRSVIESRDGSVWIGTDAGAARLGRGTNWLVLTNYTTRHGLPIDTVRALWEDRKGRLWVGTELGLDCLEDGKFQSISVPGERFGRAVRTIYEDRAGTIWFGSSQGLHKWRDGTRTTYTEADGLSANEARAILESRDGDLLVGTLGGGLNRLSFPPGAGETLSNPDLPPFLENAVRTIGSQGSAGASPSRGGVKPRVTVYSTAHGLSNDMITSLLEEPDGTLWIGTWHGLNRLKNGRITALTTADGLPDNWINSILDDDLGDLWFSSERGVFHARKEDLHKCADGLSNSVPCVVYDEGEGLLTRLTNGAKSQPAGWKCRDGTLWFATPKGVAVIDPARAKLYETAPRVVIEQVKANMAVVYDNAGVGRSQSSEGASPSRAPIRLAPGSGDVLEFHYTAPTFIAPERARFRHRLEGFQTNWVDTGTERRAYYTNLRPGNYRFQVIACNHNGIWSQTGASFAFYLVFGT